MSLREKLIEAGAHVVARDEYRNWSGNRSIQGIVAENVLDAFLDCLAENADEWAYDPAVGDLLAVLRDSE